MVTAANLPSAPAAAREREREQRVLLHGVPWSTYVVLCDTVDRPGVRMTYLEGMLEITTTSRSSRSVRCGASARTATAHSGTAQRTVRQRRFKSSISMVPKQLRLVAFTPARDTDDDNTPQQVSTISTAVQIDGGHGFTCARLEDAVSCWEANGAGMLGNGNNTESSIPLVVDL